MKNLFTYPSNSSTNFFNPTYYGALVSASQIVSGTEYYIQTVGTTDFTTVGSTNNNVGQFFQATGTPSGTGTAYIARTGILGKMLDLRGEAYKAWPITFWGTTGHIPQIQNLSKFINYYNDLKYGTNLSIFDFYSHPMTVFSKSSYNVAISSKEAVVTADGSPIWQVTHASAPHIDDNDIVDLSADPSGGSKTDFYVDAIGDTVARLYETSLGGSATPYQNNISSVRRTAFPVFVRKNTGMKALFQQTGDGVTGPTSPFGSYDDSTPEKLKFFAKDGSTGDPFDATGGLARTTSIDAGDVLYGTKTTLDTNLGYNLNTLDLFTNTGKSTVPTMTETYYGTLAITIAGPGGSSVVNSVVTNKSILDISASSSLTYTAGTVSNLANLRAKLATESAVATGFGQPLARVTVSGGSDAVLSNNCVQIDTSIDYDSLWFVNYDSTSGSEAVTVSKKAIDQNDNFNGMRKLTGSGAITVTIHFIDYAQLASGTAETTFMSATSESFTGNAIAKRIGGTPTLNKHFISGKTDIIGPGNQSYQYKDTNNATAYGARFAGTYYEDNGSQGTSQTLTGQKTPTFPINVDGNGYLTGYGTLGTINDKVGGVWDSGAGDVVLPITALADTYAPRTPSTVETDETFDTDDYWVDPAFPGSANQTNKAFPVDIPPARATITYVQPSTTNITQSGRKFVRTSQFVRYKLQVEYAPMGVDDFRKIQKAVLAAQGQSQPFYFQLRYPNDNYVLFADGSSGTGTEVINVTKLADRSTAQSIFTVGGFSQNETDALKDGEHIILGNPNGNLSMIVSGHDANNFGEVKFRISHPTSSQQGFGDKFYKNPTHVPVTLAQDEFEYFVDEQELYYVTVNFDVDEFK